MQLVVLRCLYMSVYIFDRFNNAIAFCVFSPQKSRLDYDLCNYHPKQFSVYKNWNAWNTLKNISLIIWFRLMETPETFVAACEEIRKKNLHRLLTA